MLKWMVEPLGYDPTTIPGIVSMDAAVRRARRVKNAVGKGKATQRQVIGSIEALVEAEKTAASLSQALAIPVRLLEAINDDRVWLLENCINMPKKQAA